GPESRAVQKAQGEGLGLPDEELNAQIHTFPAFQEGGRFTLKRYEEVLRRLGYTKGGFEDEMRRRLTRSKVENAVRGGVKVSDSEIEQAYVQQREEARAEWALVELAPLIAAQTATDEELQAYVKEHGQELRQPERRKVQYVAIGLKEFTKPATDAEVEKYYAEHGQEFETPKKARAAHILVRVSETGGSEAEDKAKAKIADVIRRAKAGEDVAKLAREGRRDPLGAGDFPAEAQNLRLTPHDGMIARKQAGSFAGADTMEEAAFNLSLGGVSAPVKTPAGWVVIKNLESLPAAVPPLTEIRAQVEAGVKRQKAEAVALQKAKQFADEAKHGDFQTAAKKIGA